MIAKTSTGIFLGLALAVAAAAPAQATISVFHSRAAFDAAVGATQLETFNSILFDTNPSTPDAVHVGGLTIEGVGQEIFVDAVPHTLSSLLSVDGTTQVDAYVFRAEGFDIVFDAAVLAFGADFRGLQDEVGSHTTLSFDNLTGDALAPSAGSDFELRFLGFASDTPFTRVRFRGTATDTQVGVFTYDNISYFTARGEASVPEPTGWALMIAGLGLVGGAIRRARNAPVGLAIV